VPAAYVTYATDVHALDAGRRAKRGMQSSAKIGALPALPRS